MDSWPLLPDPLTIQVYSSDDIAAAPENSLSTAGTGYTGFGLLRPFRRDKNGDFEAADGVAAIKAAVGLVLGTVCTSETTMGELPWRTEFGSLLALVRLEPNDPALEGFVQRYVIDALARWVSGIRLTECTVRRNPSSYLLRINVTYDILDTSGSRVLVPGVQTAVQVG